MNKNEIVLRKQMIGNRLRELREEYEYQFYDEYYRKLTDTEFEKRLNVTRQTYKNYENGKTKISMDAILTLAEFYDVSCDYILCKSDAKYVVNDNINRVTGLNDTSIETLNKYKKDKELMKIVNFLIENLNFNSDKRLRTKDNYSRESIIRLIQFYFNTSEDNREFALLQVQDVNSKNVNIKDGKMYVNDNFFSETIRKSELSQIKLLELQAELINLKRDLINKKRK